MLDVLSFAASVTAPIFMWITLGLVLKAIGWLSEGWISRFSQFVFYVSLPMLMFFSVVRKPLAEVFSLQLTLCCLIATFIVFWISRRYSKSNMPVKDATVFQQAALRGNLGIVGIALCLNAYGHEVLVQASVLMATITIVYNLLCVFIFVEGMREESFSFPQLVKSVLANPLITAILLGVPVALLGVELPSELLTVVDKFVALSLPLALVAIGGSLNFRSVKADLSFLLKAAGLKLIVAPILAVLMAVAMGLQGVALGVVFLLLASPTATASFVMARAYGANSKLAANAVVVSTLLSLITISAGVTVLSFLNLM